MKRSLLSAILLVESMWAIAESPNYTESLAVTSENGLYRFVLEPPRFEQTMSYEFFQSEQFALLTATEGPAAVRSATITATLFQRQEGSYKILWTRPLGTTILPRKAILLVSGRNVAIILDGQRRAAKEAVEPYSIYDFNGRCLTNGAYTSKSGDSWTFKGSVVRFGSSAQVSIPDPFK